MIGEKKFIEKVKINNILSFGPDAEEIEFKSLNVIIGPNTSGKSNFIDVIGLIRSTATDIPKYIASGGGIIDWLWKGSEKDSVGEVLSVLHYDKKKSIGHHFQFGATKGRFCLLNEQIGIINYFQGLYSIYGYNYNGARTIIYNGIAKTPIIEEIPDQTQSAVSQRKGPEYPEITFLNNNYSIIKIYRNIDTGKHAPIRAAQLTDLPEDFLLEDASNFNMVLSDLKHSYPEVIKRILNLLKDFNESFFDIDTKLYGGRAALYLRESIMGEDAPIPSSRLSDGTLKFLCLLVILLHPAPPPLICIEEPEVGLHPDMISTIADLLIEASHRTQLIITTHSDILVDALTKVPEAILVCDKIEGSTVMKRLDEKKLKDWLKKYSLGKLWLKGEIGGTRW